MKLLISLSYNSFHIETDLLKYDSKDVEVYFTKNIEEAILSSSPSSLLESMGDILRSLEEDYFLVIVHIKSTNEVQIYNDFFGSNQIFYVQRGEHTYITNDVFIVPDFSPSIKKQSVYEMVVFQGILPPETIYEDVYTIPSGVCLMCKDSSINLKEYWSIENYFKKSTDEYGTFIEKGSDALLQSFRKVQKYDTAIALSGGVDSGGLLGMMTHIHGEGVHTISVGGRGPGTPDLDSARKSVKFQKSKAQELYPVFSDLERLPSFMKGLSQPISASSLFVYALLHEQASDTGIANIVYGFGAEMLLGNLKLSKIAHLLRFEKITPQIIRNPIYSIVVKALRMNKTHIEFLHSGNWVDRFMYTRGAHYSWERSFFTTEPSHFWNSIKKKIAVYYNEELDTIDAIVKLYMKSWVNYLQMRDITALASHTGTNPVMPFDTIALTKVFLSVPTKYRKRNRWNKQLIRDIMKPFVPDHLFSNPVRSLIVPYNELFAGHEDSIFRYLKSSPIVSDLFDLDRIEKEYHSLPEAGLFILHILGVAVWYDVNFNPEGLHIFKQIFQTK